jgi:EAL domain-containing protein (putative c-di-GMP-specific phosphodiesterase class I)
MTRSLGVDYGQGFSLGRPVPLEKVLGELVAAATANQLPLDVRTA